MADPLSSVCGPVRNPLQSNGDQPHPCSSSRESYQAILDSNDVLPRKHLTLVSRSRVLTGNDYSIRSQLTAGEWLKAGLDLRSLVQQQDHYISYMPVLSSDFIGNVTDLIPANANFAVTRRIGNGYARVKLPNLPVHLFVKGGCRQEWAIPSSSIWMRTRLLRFMLAA